ncbi:serine hydrolase domain-containing protein [Catenulispora yoronensis]|uniref:Serine hydrolase domain-containing protein n=1 Tax=Catenulispora yoronensis TaxID=450799 RepID=A0ABP5GGX6_9ACTN
MAEIQGSYEQRFAAVAETLAEQLDKVDLGASVAVFVGGEPVVDIWGGYFDAARTTPWERDTMTTVNSTTKPMTALCALLLIDRGDLDPDAPVARYWPEFAAAGKENVLVRHVLSHTAGLADWPGTMTVDELYDWDACITRLAAAPPQWEPGTACGYHSMTFGYLIGELVRRISGRSLGTYFADEVAGPLGADFHIGLSAQDEHRVAPLVAPPGLTDEFSSAAAVERDGEPAAGGVRVKDANSVAWHQAEIPAANGIGNARSAALVQAALGNGGVARGARLLSEAGCERAWRPEFSGKDRIITVEQTYSLGFGVFGTTFGWGGWGGSMVMTDPKSHLTVAYVMNQMLDPLTMTDGRGLGLVMAAYGGLT